MGANELENVNNAEKQLRAPGERLIGEFEHNIDAKNRLFIPSQLRKHLGETFVISKAPEKCLFAYSLEEWDRVTAPIHADETTDEAIRKSQRAVYRGVAMVEIDKQGRITVPKRFREYANLEKEVMVFGAGNRVEIWNLDVWEEMENEAVAFPSLKY